MHMRGPGQLPRCTYRDCPFATLAFSESHPRPIGDQSTTYIDTLCAASMVGLHVNYMLQTAHV